MLWPVAPATATQGGRSDWDPYVGTADRCPRADRGVVGGSVGIRVRARLARRRGRGARREWSSSRADAAKVQEIVRRFQDTNHTPGVLIGIWSPKGTFVSATGVADLATGEPLNTDMQFKIASQTKTFTANLILQLVGEGKISLDDHISKWIAGVPNGRPDHHPRAPQPHQRPRGRLLSPGHPSAPGYRLYRRLPAHDRGDGASGRGARHEVVLQQLRLQPARASGGAGHRPGPEHGDPKADRHAARPPPNLPSDLRQRPPPAVHPRLRDRRGRPHPGAHCLR